VEEQVLEPLSKEDLQKQRDLFEGKLIEFKKWMNDPTTILFFDGLRVQIKARETQTLSNPIKSMDAAFETAHMTGELYGMRMVTMLPDYHVSELVDTINKLRAAQTEGEAKWTESFWWVY